MIRSHDNDDDILTAGSHFCGSDSETNENGVACSHAYSVLHTYILEGGAHAGTKMLKIRNPWGSEQYNANWSDGDSKWTQDYKD